MRALLLLPVLVFVLAACQPTSTELASTSASFSISFTSDASSEALDGRLLVILSKDDEREPRFQVRPGVRAVQMFGINIDGVVPGQEVVIDESVFGYPFDSLKDLPAGDYFVQALLHKYDTFELANGNTVKLPMDQGEGQQWAESPDNLYSEPRLMRVAASAEPIAIVMDQVVPAIPPPPDTEFVKHVRIKSDLLSEFWGMDMYLGAHVLLPS